MNRWIKFGTMGTLALTSAVSMAQEGIEVTVNGNPVHFHGQGPIERSDRVMVPLRGVLEQMGADVRWDSADQTVMARSSGTRVRLRIGDQTAFVNGQPVNLDVPAQIIDGSTMVPLRFVGEALGNTVHWDAEAQTVEIMTGGDTSYTVAQGQDRYGYSRAERFDQDHWIFHAGTTFRVILDSRLSSADNSRGDRFSASLGGDRRGLPSGTKFEGYVAEARPRTDDRPGWLVLRFDRIDMPDGDSFPIRATMVSYGAQSERAHNAWFEAGSRLTIRLTSDAMLHR